jgi:hypothetical protein
MPCTIFELALLSKSSVTFCIFCQIYPQPGWTAPGFKLTGGCDILVRCDDLQHLLWVAVMKPPEERTILQFLRNSCYATRRLADGNT